MKSNRSNSLKAATIAAAFLTLVAAARAEVEDKITKNFKVQPGGQLVMDVDRGNIEIKTADGEAVDIAVERKAGGSKSKAERTLKDHEVTITQDGNKVEVRAEFKGAKYGGWFGRSPELQVDYVIALPRKFDADLKTAGGHIKVGELTGKLKAHTSGGNLTFEKIVGPVSANTSGGHVTLAGCKGKVELKTSGGNLKLSDIEGDVTAGTSGGHVNAARVTGNTVLKTSGGNVEVAEIKGSVEATTSGGHMSAAKVSGKTVLKTSGGNITVSGIGGPIEANTSGGNISAELLEQPAGDCSFKTSAGNVTLALAAKVAVDVDAHTSGGRVSTDLPVAAEVQGEQKDNTLRGKINGGGPLLTAHTGGGHVRFVKK